MENLKDKFNSLFGESFETSTVPERKELQRDYAIYWLHRGERVSVVAEKLGVTQKTIYQWKQNCRDEFIQELENLKYIDVFAENLQEIEDLKSMCLKMAHHITDGYLEWDSELEKMVRGHGSVRDLSELMRLVRDFLKLKIELQTQVGHIPKKPEHLYADLKEQQAQEIEKEFQELNREELEARTLKNLKNQSIL